MPPVQPQYQPQAPQGHLPQYQSANSRKPSPFSGALIAAIVLAVLLVVALIFAIWAFSERGTYKNKTDQIVAKEVELAKQQTSDQKDKEFVEKEKNPLKEYKGPATYGSLHIQYPKTWSAYIDESSRGSLPINGYFHPNFVPGLSSGTAFALRVEVVSSAYDAEVRAFEARVKTGKVKVTPYTAAKVPGTAGSRIEGEINQGQRGVMVLFPVRDKTIKISTQTDTFLKDFDDIILANLTFVP